MTDMSFTLSPSQRARRATVHQRGDDGTLTPTAFEIPQHPEFHMGGGGLYGTAADYLAFTRMIVNGGRVGDAQVLRPETIETMARNHIGDLDVPLMKSLAPAFAKNSEFFPGMTKKWGAELPDQYAGRAHRPLGRQPRVVGCREHLLLDRPVARRVGRVPVAGAAVLRRHGDRPVHALRDGGVPPAMNSCGSPPTVVRCMRRL